MKFVKSIGLFVVYPLLTAGLGFALGFGCARFYDTEKAKGFPLVQELTEQEDAGEKSVETEEAASGEEEPEKMPEAEVAEAAALPETLSVDTVYVLEEMDVEDHSSVETVWRLPAKYVGMDREQFLEAMELYEAFPPLSEKERGFVGVEVLSFSRERVVVQMNYQYVQPSTSFYLAVINNEVVVYLEDQETVYLYTGIPLERLPETVQLQIMQMLWVEDEESLYDFLESYSS